jgi:hypothetical protein
MNTLPLEIKFLIINNLDNHSKIYFMSSTKILNNYFKKNRSNEILNFFIKNNCKNISKNQRKSIIKNNKNNCMTLQNKIFFMNKLNNIINKRYTDG